MDAQINRMAVQIEKKIQEMFKKYLEEIKTRQSTMNNITNKKYTRRQPVAEYWGRRVDKRAERMVEGKKNEMRKVSDFWDNIKYITIWIIGFLEEEVKRKDNEKIFEEIIIIETYLTWERK